MHKITNIIFSVFLLFILGACAQTHSTLEEPNSVASAPSSKQSRAAKELIKETHKDAPTPNMNNCVCVQLWMPVCGENGKTYSNSCFADCAREKYTQGSCSKTITD